VHNVAEGAVYGGAPDAGRSESGESARSSQMRHADGQAVLAKIRTISRSHVVRPGLQIFKDRKPGQEIKLTKADVPGLGELPHTLRPVLS